MRDSVCLRNPTMYGQVELPCGFACDVAGHTGITGSVIELSLVDL